MRNLSMMMRKLSMMMKVNHDYEVEHDDES